jgi:hypothetical protein
MSQETTTSRSTKLLTYEEFINLPGFPEHCDCFPQLGFFTLKDGSIFKLGHLGSVAATPQSCG